MGSGGGNVARVIYAQAARLSTPQAGRVVPRGQFRPGTLHRCRVFSLDFSLVLSVYRQKEHKK